MSTTQKGSELEDKLFEYLLSEQERDAPILGIHLPNLCRVYKQKSYWCSERGGNVTFDVIIEIRRPGAADPHIYVLFECKNHKRPIQERDVTDFSDKARRVFGHAAKCMLVFSSKLQTGAENIAKNRGIGIVKFDENGIDIIADRISGTWTEKRFVKSQIFEGSRRSKSLRFSALLDGQFFDSANQLLRSFEGDPQVNDENSTIKSPTTVRFLENEEIQRAAQEALNKIHYEFGAVDLVKLSSDLAIELVTSEQVIYDSDGNPVLGTANFADRSIQIYRHENRQRERFTIAHEIGHFCLLHDRYLRSDSIVEHDMFLDMETRRNFNYGQLEYQANTFASELLLPDRKFRLAVQEKRQHLSINDKGFGYIFVDDQPCNYTPYNQMISALSENFEVSKQAIEVRLKRMGLVTDKRRNL